LISGYDLLNEPTPTRNCDQSRTLAQEIVTAIRSVDRNHLIIVEKVDWVIDRNGRSPADPRTVYNNWQFLVDDANVMYDFHYYWPRRYALQYAPGSSNPDGGRYPDNNVSEELIDLNRMPRNLNFMRHQLEILTAFGRRYNVPMNVGEFGIGPRVYELSDKGGYAYTQYMLNLMNEFNLNFTHFSYDWMYFNWQNRSNAIQPLFTMLRSFLAESQAPPAEEPPTTEPPREEPPAPPAEVPPSERPRVGLFSISAQFQSYLDDPNVSALIRWVFSITNNPLANNATIRAYTPNREWVIESSGTQYYVLRRNNVYVNGQRMDILSFYRLQ
jgi:hypothetical protein